MATTQQERFLARIEVLPSGCWKWIKSIGTHGYGNYTLNGKRVTASRAAYLLFKGPLEMGMEPDHCCKPKPNRWCCCPEHLEAVTRKENVRRMHERNGTGQYATHCPAGHEFTPENTRYYAGQRRCFICETTHRGTRPLKHEPQLQRTSNSKKTHCPKGHEYTPENTYLHKGGRGDKLRRRCRICTTAGNRKP